jgi:hypothetical protein
VVDLLHERDDVAALAAAEAVPEADRAGATWNDGVVSSWNGHSPFMRPDPGRAQRDVLADDLVDARPLADGVDVLAADPHRAECTFWPAAEPVSSACQATAPGVGHRRHLVDDDAQPPGVVARPASRRERRSSPPARWRTAARPARSAVSAARVDRLRSSTVIT